MITRGFELIRRCPSTRHVLAGISLVNLCLVPFWEATGNKLWIDLAKSPPRPTVYVAAMVAVVMCGTVCAIGMRWVKSASDMWCRVVGTAAITVFCLSALNGLRALVAQQIPFFQLGGLLSLIRNSPIAAGTTAVGGLGCMVWVWQKARHRLLTAAEFVLVALSPLAPLTFGSSLWAIAKFDDSAFADKPLAPLNGGNGLAITRVVWVIFDEWDQRLTFDTGRRFPSLDRLPSEVIQAHSALPPGADTLVSMAGFITGHIVRKAEVQAPDKVLLTLWNGERRWLGAEPTLFTNVQAGGGQGAVIGWHVPYGRLFPGQLAVCWWTGLPERWNAVEGGFWKLLGWQLRSLFEAGYASPFGQPVMLQRHGWVYGEVLRRGKDVAADPKIALALVHFPIPHMPAIYNPRSGRLDRRISTPAGYLDNLMLVDRTVGDLRRTMEAAGLWDTSTVLLSSDHWYRASAELDGKIDHRVPFLLKLAGQKRGIVYDKPFNTVLTHDLILAILRGELTTPEQVVAWLDVHRLTPEGQYRP